MPVARSRLRAAILGPGHVWKDGTAGAEPTTPLSFGQLSQNKPRPAQTSARGSGRGPGASGLSPRPRPPQPAPGEAPRLPLPTQPPPCLQRPAGGRPAPGRSGAKSRQLRLRGGAKPPPPERPAGQGVGAARRRRPAALAGERASGWGAGEPLLPASFPACALLPAVPRDVAAAMGSSGRSRAGSALGSRRLSGAQVQGAENWRIF